VVSTAADALFFESPGSVVCCSLNERVVITLIQFSFEGVLVLLDGFGLFGDVLVGVIIDSENGLEVLQFGGLKYLVTGCFWPLC
jgi:hypothetical protein